MDFIERWFHLSPDNGSGATEGLFLLGAVLLIVAVANRRRIAEFAKRHGKHE
jgi:hypothetical protein